MAMSMALLGLVFESGRLQSMMGSVSAVVGLAVFKAAFSLSWGPVLWIVLPEILPLRARSAGMGACVFATYVVNFCVALVFPDLLAAGPGAAFGAFAVIGVGAALLVYGLLPNTTGQSLECIEISGETMAVRGVKQMRPDVTIKRASRGANQR
jgi:hypothetical protein